MPNPRRINFDAYFLPLLANRLTALTAGGAGDNTEIVGATIDRKTAAGGMHDSVAFEIPFTTNAANGKALNVIGTLEHSDDGTTWVAAPAAQQPSGAAGGSIGTIAGTGAQQDGCFEFVPPKAAVLKEFVRLKFTPDLTAANTDTAIIGAVAIVAGGQILPE